MWSAFFIRCETLLPWLILFLVCSFSDSCIQHGYILKFLFKSYYIWTHWVCRIKIKYFIIRSRWLQSCLTYGMISSMIEYFSFAMYVTGSHSFMHVISFIRMCVSQPFICCIHANLIDDNKATIYQIYFNLLQQFCIWSANISVYRIHRWLPRTCSYSFFNLNQTKIVKLTKPKDYFKLL